MNIIILGCNGNIGKFISVTSQNILIIIAYGIDLHNKFLGETDKVNYYQDDFLTNGLNKNIKKYDFIK